jgi:lysophospholipase L1-like esterase
MTGIACTNEGLSSATFDEWYAQKASVLTSGYDMAIIQLGVNDRFRYEGWTQTAETALNNIVSDLQAANEGIKIFVATIIPALGFKGTIFDEISQGIRDAVATINDPNVILIDMAAYGHTDDNQGYNVGHLSELGYTRLAMDYRNYISWIMSRDMVAFRNIQNIGTDYYFS